MILAHDQHWGWDDWLTIALIPPEVFLLSLLFVMLINWSSPDRWDTLRSSAVFLGTACGGAWLLLWLIIGTAWLVGWL